MQWIFDRCAVCFGNTLCIAQTLFLELKKRKKQSSGASSSSQFHLAETEMVL
jgi:hypothetical protein